VATVEREVAHGAEAIDGGGRASDGGIDFGRRRRRLVGRRWLPWVTTPLLAGAMVGLWQLYVSVSGVTKFVLPGPAAVFSAFGHEIANGFVWRAEIWPTLYQTLLGFAIGSAIGILLGFLIGKSALLETVANPFIVATQVIPQVALVPLFILWFGFGSSAKVVTATILCFFPMVTNTAFGVKSVPRSMHELFTSLHASRLQRFFRLDIPYALANILTGAQVAIVLATIGAIVAEYLAGNSGLGAYAISLQNNLQIPDLFGAILIMSVLGFLLYLAVTFLRRLLIPWHESVTVRTRAGE
jgi:NitT/TauT family transport system permease protein